MNHETAFELLPLFSLDALEEEDTRAVEAHVSGCLVCRSELASYLAVTDALSGELDPGPEVWTAILARIAVA